MKNFILSITFAIALVLGSCGDLTELNEDPKSPNNVPAETLFSNAQMSLGTYLSSSDTRDSLKSLERAIPRRSE